MNTFEDETVVVDLGAASEQTKGGKVYADEFGDRLI